MSGAGSIPYQTHAARVVATVLVAVVPAYASATIGNATGRSSIVRNVYAGKDLAAAIAEASSGDVILVHAGTYPHMRLTEQFASKVTVEAMTGDAVTLRGIELWNASFLTFKGFTIDAGSNSVDNVRVYGAAHDIVIAGNRIRGGSSGISVGRQSGPGRTTSTSTRTRSSAPTMMTFTCRASRT